MQNYPADVATVVKIFHGCGEDALKCHFHLQNRLVWMVKARVVLNRVLSEFTPEAEVIKPYSVLRDQIPCSSLAFTPCSYAT